MTCRETGDVSPTIGSSGGSKALAHVNAALAPCVLRGTGGEVAKADKAREELGWLKVLFAVSAAVDASVLGWLAQKYDSAHVLLVVVAIVVAAGLTTYVAWMNVVAYRRIRELESL